MKRLLFFFLLLFIMTCTSEKTAEVGSIDFRIMEFSEAQASARDTGKMLLAYFYTDW